MPSKNYEGDRQDRLFYDYHHEESPVSDPNAYLGKLALKTDTPEGIGQMSFAQISTQGYLNSRPLGETEPDTVSGDRRVQGQIAEPGSLEKALLEENAILRELVIILGYFP